MQDQAPFVLLRHSLLFVLLCLAALSCTVPPCTASRIEPCPDNSISISVTESDQPGGHSVSFFVSAERTLESTVTFDCSALQNMEPDHQLPYTFVVTQAGKPLKFLQLHQVQKTGDWSFGDWQFHNTLGRASERQTINYLYALPYSKSEHYRVLQSYFGSFSHFRGSHNEYAVDFDMPEGRIVRACRPGIVVALRYDSDAGGKSEKFKRSDNYVVIKHDDGTYGNYAHFQQNGVVVKLGQIVAEGEQLGLSGQTGWADRPHLHFVVYRVIDGMQRESIPISFRLGNTVITRPIKGQFY